MWEWWTKAVAADKQRGQTGLIDWILHAATWKPHGLGMDWEGNYNIVVRSEKWQITSCWKSC